MVEMLLPDESRLEQCRSAPELAAQYEIALADLAAIPDVAAALVKQPLEGADTFTQLCGWRSQHFASEGTVERWAAKLQGDREDLHPERSVETPRLLASALATAWIELRRSAGPEGVKEGDREKLIANFLHVIPLCAEEGTRTDDEASPPPAATLANALTRLLMEETPPGS